MNVEEKLIEMDKKLDLLVERQHVDSASTARLRQVVYGDNGLRLRVRLLEEDRNRGRWFAKVALTALVTAIVLWGWSSFVRP